MSRRYLVTGGAGFLGRGLVRALLARGDSVRILDSHFRGHVSRLGELASKVDFVEGDIRDAGTVLKACREIDAVCHLAFINGTEYFYSKPDLVLDVGVRGMLNVLDACIETGVRDLILASSSEVYQLAPVIPTDETVPLSIPDPLNPRYSYAGGKIISELLALNYGRKHFDRVTIFRPHNVYGPDMGTEHVVPQFILQMGSLARRSAGTITFPIQGTGNETRAFIHADDFTDGLMRVIDSGAHLEIYHIGTDVEVRIAEVARMVAQYFGREVVIVPGEPTPGGTPRRCPDITKLRKLGFEPRVPLAEGVTRTAAWYDAAQLRADK